MSDFVFLRVTKAIQQISDGSMIEARRLWSIAILGSLLISLIDTLRWSGRARFPLSILSTRPLLRTGVQQLSVAQTQRIPVTAVHNIIEELKHNIVVQNNATSTLRNLINVGDHWIKWDDPAQAAATNFVQSELERVKGCTSTVKIKTSYVPASPGLCGKDELSRNTIRVEGTADSRVTQGMLAILCKIFNALKIEEALSLSAAEVTQYFGIDALLPTGRQNTFHNMILLIQSQLRRLVDDRVSSNTISMSEQLSESCDKLVADTMASPALCQVAALTASAGAKASGAAKQEADPRGEEVALLLSGGVDSSVALKLLLEQGHRVRAYYLKIWLEDELAHLNSCPWEEDLQYAQAVCDQLGVPLETVSLQKEYWRDVVQYTLQEARRGRTPNPDIMCNSRVKFGTFYDYVGRFHSKIASGHYAQVKPIRDLHSADLLTSGTTSAVERSEHDGVAYDPEEVVLVRSPDSVKDQSYFLCNLQQAQLRRCLFPIGHLQKSEVRRLAESFNLPTKLRRDSQGICFLGKLKFDDFIEHYLGQSLGVIRSVDTGEELGQHRGLWFHTLGQRKGLGALMKSGTVNFGPWYVSAKDMRSNTLFVSNVTHVHTDSGYPAYVVENVNWINGPPQGLVATGESLTSTEGGLRVQMKLRHSPVLVDGLIYKVNGAQASSSNVVASVVDAPSSDENTSGQSVVVRLQDPTESVAPGQFVAFYRGEMCIGSGVVADLPVPDVPAAPLPELRKSGKIKVRRRTGTKESVDSRSGEQLLVTELVESLSGRS